MEGVRNNGTEYILQARIARRKEHVLRCDNIRQRRRRAIGAKGRGKEKIRDVRRLMHLNIEMRQAFLLQKIGQKIGCHVALGT